MAARGASDLTALLTLLVLYVLKGFASSLFDLLRELTKPRGKGWWSSSDLVGQSMATRHFAVCVETPESRTQVFMFGGGELAVHDNVVFVANSATGGDGGAVSRPLEIGFTLP
jgi:hypothetical protein